MSARIVEERKRKLDGRVLRYRCAALHLSKERAVLLYRMEHAADVGEVHVPAGAVSFGVYWTARPYNVYHFVDAAGETLGYYCNAATETRISREAVDWLDLEVDFLITPDGRARMLDLELVPPDLAAERRAALGSAISALGRVQQVVADVEACTGPYRRLMPLRPEAAPCAGPVAAPTRRTGDGP